MYGGFKTHMCTYGGLIVYIYKSLHAQNLKLCWITNCQLHVKCQHYSLFLPNSPLHLGSCGLPELARLCRCLRPAPVGPVFLSWTSFISVAEPFLSSIGPPGPLNCWHRPPPTSLPLSSELQHAAKIVRCVSSAYWSGWPKEVGPQHFTEYIM